MTHWTKAGEAEIEKYEAEQRDRELDDEAIDREQDRYERSLGWTHD